MLTTTLTTTIRNRHLVNIATRSTRGTNDLEASDRTRQAFEQTRKFERYNNVMSFNKRLGMALFGGLVLILPMLIMVLHPNKTKSLITSSIFTMAFALAQAF